MTGRERLAALAIMASVAVVAILAMALTSPRQPAEDDPGWDCRTMGNHQCGPTP